MNYGSATGQLICLQRALYGPHKYAMVLVFQSTHNYTYMYINHICGIYEYIHGFVRRLCIILYRYLVGI